MMRLCAMCHRRPANSATSSQCRPCHTAYQRTWKGPARIGPRAKMLAWLRSGARTPRQLAELVDITPQHAASQVWQMRRAGLIEPVDTPQRGQPCRYRVTR